MSDTQAPQLLGVTLDTTTLDPSTPGGAFLSGAITFSDDISGPRDISIEYTEVNSGQSYSLSVGLTDFGGNALTNGNALNGTIKGSIQLDRFAASGDYIISSIFVVDQAGNQEDFSSFDNNWDTQLDAFNIAEEARSFTVVNSGADTQAPQLLGVTLDTTTLDPSTPGGAFLSGAITFSDDISGPRDISIEYTEVNSGQSYSLSVGLTDFGGNALTNGNALNGTIKGSIQLDRFAASGDYIISSIFVVDQAGNQEDFSSFDNNWDTQLDAFNIAEEARSFTVVNSGADTQAPQLLGVTLDTTTLDPSTPGGAFLSGAITFSDDISGPRDISIEYTEVNSGQSYSLSVGLTDFGGNALTNGNALNGTIKGSIQLDRFAASGDYIISSIFVVDQAGNQEDFSSFDNNWDTQLDAFNIAEEARSFTVVNSGAEPQTGEDISAPTITGLNLSATTIDPSQPGGAFLTADVSFTDDASGIDNLFLQFESVDTSQQITFSLFPEDSDVSLNGTLLEGSIATSRFIDPFAASGDYVLSYIQGTDKAGNLFNKFKDDSDWQQFLSDSNIQKTSFEIINPQSDISAPTITGLNLSATTIDPSQPRGAFLTADVSFTDDASGIDNLFLQFESVDTSQQITFSLFPEDSDVSLNGTLLEGSIATSRFIDPFAASGDYVLSYIQGTDKAGNLFNKFKDDSDWQQFLSDSNIQKTSFEIINPQSDISAPTITGLNLSATTIDPSQPGGAFLTADVSFTDDASGIDNLFLQFESVDTSQQITFSLFPEDSDVSLNGTLLEGSIATSRFIDPFAASGDYVLSYIQGTDKAGNLFNKFKDDSDWQQFLSDSNIQQTSFEITQSDSDNGAVDADNNGLLDNTPVYTLFNDGDPLTITKERSDGSTRTFSATGIPNWDATQAVNAEDNSGNFYVLLEGADGTTREDQFKVWTTDNTGLISSETGWRSAEQLVQAGWEERFNIDFDGDELIGIPIADENEDGLVDNTPIYTLFNDGDPLTITKERSDGSTRTFSSTGIPNWDATQAVNAEDNSGNFYVLLEGADGTTREDQFKVWTTDNTGLISSETGWRSAEQLVQAGWEERFNIDFDGDELIGIPIADENEDGLVDNTPIYTLFNDGDPLTITKERSDGSTRTFSSTGIPNWDATQAVNAEDNSGNFYVLLEGADGTTREDQFKVWTTDNTGLISSETGWRSAEQLVQAGWETIFGDIFNSGGIEDTTPPELLSYTLSDYNIDLSDGDVTIDVTAAIRDDISGVFDGTFADGVGSSPSQVTWTSPSGTQRVFGGIFDDPVTGDFLNGTYTDQAVFNQFSENGTWTLDNFLVVDEAGNSNSLRTDQLNELGIQTTLEVIGGIEDTTPPELLSYTLSDYNIDLSDGDVTIDVTAAIRDDISGVFDGTFADGVGSSPSQVTWTSPSGTQRVFGGIFDDPVTGDFLNGTYTDQAVFNQFSENGTWTLDNFLVVDEAGNSNSLRTDQLNELGIQTTLEVIGGIEDTTPPELLSYTLSDYNIDLSDGDVTIDVTAAIRDDISGVFDGTFADGVGSSPSQVTWTSPSGTQRVFGGIFDDPVTGDFLNGTYTDQAVFNQFSENGTWTLDNFLVVDEAGNSNSLRTDQLNELGIQTTLEVIGGMSNLTPNSTELLT